MKITKILLSGLLLILLMTASVFSAEPSRHYPAVVNIIKIELPLGLKWRVNIAEAAKILKISALSVQNTHWAKFEKDGLRYWLYFTNGQYLSQITVLFNTNSLFTEFMKTFTAKYSEQRVKDNLFRDRITTVGIEATLKPQVVYILNEN